MLTARAVTATNTPGRYHDGQGLYLQVRSPKNKSWLFIYQRDGKQRWVGLGRADVVTLRAARRKAHDLRVQLAEGVDPFQQKQKAKQEARQSQLADRTVEQMAKEYVRLKGSSWKSPKTGKQFLSALNRHTKAVMRMSVKDVTVNDVVSALEPIWTTTPVMAEHVRANLSAVLNAAEARGLRNGNPAELKVVKAAGLEPEHAGDHFDSMPYTEVPALMQKLAQREGIGPMALRFTILTVARTHMTIGARWSEIDFDKKVWTIPGAQMKGKKNRSKDHRIPLSAQAIAILKQAPRERGNPYVFVGGNAGLGLSNNSMLKLLREYHPTATVHGFRTSFKDWGREGDKYSDELTELALSHVVGTKTRRAYARSDLFDLRVPLMTAWARFITKG